MSTWINYGTAGASGGGFSCIVGTFQFDEAWAEPRWSWQQRAPKTAKDKYWWRSVWSFGCKVGYGSAPGDDGTGVAPGLVLSDGFEPYSCDGEGSSVSRFIRGIVKDSVAVTVADATVQGFVTATDQYIGQTISNADGTFTLGTDTPIGTQHYLVVYKAGSPDVAGTSVNTLTSTLVDGT